MKITSLPLGLTISLVAILTLWMASAAQPSPASTAADSLALANPDTVKIQVYPKHYARFELDITGDGGSRTRMSVFWDGIYLVPQMNLTRQFRAGTTSVPVYIADCYYLIPMTVTYRITGRVDTTYDHEDASVYAWANHRSFWNVNTSVTLPVPPLEKPASSNEVQRWMGKYRGWVHEGDAYDWTSSLTIHDRRLAGGGIKIVPNVNYSGKGMLPTRTAFHSTNKPDGRTISGNTLANVPLVAGLTTDPAAVMPLVTRSLARFDWGVLTDEATMLTPLTLDSNALAIEHRGTVSGEPQLVGHYRQAVERWQKKDKATLYSDRKATARFSWSVGLKTEVDATLEPVASDEKSFLPVPNSVRKYKLKINKPTLDKVQGLRVWLEGVSAHPGIATNAGQHHLWWGNCPHCTNCQKQTVAHHSTYKDWSTSPPTRYSLPRYYHQYNACALDRLPDLFFRDFDNKGWTQGDRAIKDGLKYAVSDELIREQPDANEYVISLAVEDAAASGYLRADILVNNAWMPVKCVGATADEFGLSLSIPLDKNGDGIADAWTDGAGLDPYCDSDSSANTKSLGDGLTVFEEYRGVYTAGMNHERLSPKVHDLFVHDYTHLLGASLTETARLYRAEGIALHQLQEGQFSDDVVNWNSDCQAGRQYMLVVMDAGIKPDHVPQSNWDAIWKSAAGIASDITSPVDKTNTVFVTTSTAGDKLPALLAHELGHNINCQHHGSLNRTVTLKNDAISGQSLADGDYYIAVAGGENSGDTSCFMRYQYANLACLDKNIPLPVKSNPGTYQLYTWPGTRTCFCNAKNSNIIPFLGEASRGNCQNQIRIRSYTWQTAPGSLP